MPFAARAWQDYADTPHAVHCLSALLAHRLLVGVFVGAGGASDDGGEAQAWCLIAASAALLAYVVAVRPVTNNKTSSFAELISTLYGRNSWPRCTQQLVRPGAHSRAVSLVITTL